MLRIKFMSNPDGFALMWMRRNMPDDKSILVREMFWFSGATSHHLSKTLGWRHNGHDSVSNHQPYDCLISRLFRRRWKKTSKPHVTGLCAGNSPGTAQMASNAENVSIWWRHHGFDQIYAALWCVMRPQRFSQPIYQSNRVIHIFFYCRFAINYGWFEFNLMEFIIINVSVFV